MSETPTTTGHAWTEGRCVNCGTEAPRPWAETCLEANDTETLAEVRLTDAEAVSIANWPAERGSAALIEYVERILAARIEQARAGEGALRERIEALADEWVREADERGQWRGRGYAERLRAVLADTAGRPGAG